MDAEARRLGKQVRIAIWGKDHDVDCEPALRVQDAFYALTRMGELPPPLPLIRRLDDTTWSVTAHGYGEGHNIETAICRSILHANGDLR